MQFGPASSVGHAGRGRRNCPQLLKSSRDTSHGALTPSQFSLSCGHGFSVYATADDIFSPSLPFKLFL